MKKKCKHINCTITIIQQCVFPNGYKETEEGTEETVDENVTSIRCEDCGELLPTN